MLLAGVGKHPKHSVGRRFREMNKNDLTTAGPYHGTAFQARGGVGKISHPLLFSPPTTAYAKVF
ncbi:hypothetical protein ThrDRAFT_04730 [Frankia casuarinae]|nr:hypothetical protein CcI6DRAFT_04216 [Frankia sp. CcI6]EYT89654.1 hypothetical protein ThrDRAFT_04730 [Frankia casuarinae]KDA41349.1 hypothetical protein BMG523Draft_03835 [Frankia sp. BMG5.23]KEZ34329.1 hypothetical protein CEDDRAFT_04322 [Frankia sp. CeD]KFB04623.1 hypothetical protein ALLO2DRAFT_02552 [Frankia sp. Allo2]